MNDRLRSIVEEARKLTPEERRELVDLLEVELNSEQEGTPEEIEAAWLEEIRERIAQSERGETVPVEMAEAIARARARIR
jgi:hypothetical protein